MSYIDLYLYSPYLFFLVLVISLIITVLVYSAFPVILAITRKKAITKKKYKGLCYGFNIIGLAFFIAFNGASSGAPYLLWTWVFSRYGLKKLNMKGLLVESIPRKKKASAIVGIENSAQTEENLSAKVEVEESKKTTKTELKLESNSDKQSMSLLKSRIKILKIIFFILTGVSIVLLLASLIGCWVSDFLWDEAYWHYQETKREMKTMGCGQDACKFCDGVQVPYSSNRSFDLSSTFKYYRNVTDFYFFFEALCCIFLVLAIIFAIISLLVIIIPKIVDAKRSPKSVPKTAEKQNDSLFAQNKKINFCKYCGGKIDSDSKFCPYCGKKL